MSHGNDLAKFEQTPWEGLRTFRGLVSALKLSPWPWIVIFIALWLFGQGCTTIQTFQPACRHQALLAATTLRDAGIPYRIQVGPTSRKGVYHAQTQALVDGQWVWVQVWSRMEVGSMEQVGWTPERTVEIEEAQGWR